MLFVDDEEDVLSGLRLSLRRLQRDYRLLFASGADEAVALLDREPVDLIVTDMRMPDRSGVDLLEEVRFRFPDVVRYVLSDQAGDRLVHRSMAVTHRWLAKPCHPDVLIEALAEATGRRAEMLDPQVRRAVGAVDALPSHPAVHGALVELFDRDRATSETVAALAVGDPALTAKLVQWANSDAAGQEPIYDAGRAVERIGLDALDQLVRADDIVRPFTPSEVIPGFGVDLFGRHARAVAAVAAALTAPDAAALATAGGLLSRVGLLVQVGHLRDRLDLAYQRAVANRHDLARTERDLFDTSHVELGAHLLALWGLPTPLVDVVAGSHHVPDPEASLPLSPLDAVRAARLLVQRLPLSRAVGEPHRSTIDDETGRAIDRLADHLDLIECTEIPNSSPPSVRCRWGSR